MSIMDLKKNAPKGEFLAYINKEEAAMLKKAGGSGKLVNGIPSFRPQDWGQEKKAETAREEGKQTPASNPYAGAGQGSKSDSTVKDDGRGYTTETQDYNTYLATGENPLNLDIERIERFGGPTLTTKEITKKENQNLFYNSSAEFNKPKYPSYIPSYIQAAANFNRKPNRKYFYDKVIKNNAANLDLTELEKAYEEYMDNRMAGYTDAMGNTHPNYRKDGDQLFSIDRGSSNQPIISNFQSPIIEDVEDEPYNQFTYRMGDTQGVGRNVTLGYLADGGRARKAEGGIMGLRARKAFGGIMDRVTGRRAYGLGSIFKGVKKAVSGVVDATKKVLKSDIGKAALLYAGGTYLGGTAMFGGNAAAGSFGSRLMNPFGPNSFGSLFMNSSKKGILNRAGSLFSKDGALDPRSMVGKKNDGIMDNVVRFGKYLAPAYLLSKTKLGEAPPNEESYMADRTNNKLIDPLNNRKSDPAAMTATLNEALENAGGDPDKIAAINRAYRFLNDPRLGDDGAKSVVPGLANGGRIGRAEGGLMDLGGMEKDYRNDGGFVPIGEYEKKDDVPARLSVNEFVFTADAVRGAGQGDIDKGAEIMENMMENLENGGTVSEESQGNKGAQQMFETSQRLGEVV